MCHLDIFKCFENFDTVRADFSNFEIHVFVKKTHTHKINRDEITPTHVLIFTF